MKSTYIEKQAVLLNGGWLSNKDIAILLEVGTGQASKIRGIVLAEIKASGKDIPRNRQVPVSWVIKKYDVPVKEIHENAALERQIKNA